MNISVNYCSAIGDPTGYGEAAREFVTALYVTGVDVTVEKAVFTRDNTDYGWRGYLCDQLMHRNNNYKIKIIHLTPDIYEKYMEDGIYHIGHLMWETDKLPYKWANYCNKLDEIWATSPHMIELFKRSGVKVPMFYFPQPIDILDAEKEYEKYVILPHRGYLFYSIFQWIGRKNPKALLKAYWKEFEGEEEVGLLLKTFRLDYSNEEFGHIRSDIVSWRNELGRGHWPRVYLVNRLMTKEEIMRVHNTGDCLVLTHRGEGWNRVILESLLMKKPVISTARGGVHEYLRPEHYFPIESYYVPVEEVSYIKFYTKDQMWAEIKEEELRETMRFVFNNRDTAKAKGDVGCDFIKESFNYWRVGSMMRKRLEEIYKHL